MHMPEQAYWRQRAHNPGFVPLATERYDLVLSARDRAVPPLNWLPDPVKSAEFRSVASHLGGYDTRCPGREIFIGQPCSRF
jgi:hypothetical protein